MAECCNVFRTLSCNKCPISTLCPHGLRRPGSESLLGENYTTLSPAFCRDGNTCLRILRRVSWLANSEVHRLHCGQEIAHRWQTDNVFRSVWQQERSTHCTRRACGLCAKDCLEIGTISLFVNHLSCQQGVCPWTHAPLRPFPLTVVQMCWFSLTWGPLWLLPKGLFHLVSSLPDGRPIF